MDLFGSVDLFGSFDGIADDRSEVIVGVELAVIDASKLSHEGARHAFVKMHILYCSLPSTFAQSHI